MPAARRWRGGIAESSAEIAPALLELIGAAMSAIEQPGCDGGRKSPAVRAAQHAALSAMSAPAKTMHSASGFWLDLDRRACEESPV